MNMPFQSNPLVALIVTARAQAHGVAEDMTQTVERLMGSDHQSLRENLVRQIEQDSIFHAPLLRDLDAMIGLINETVAAGMQSVWIDDEYSVSGGYDTVVCSDETADLASAGVRLIRFRQSVAIAIEFAQALRDADRLLGL